MSTAIHIIPTTCSPVPGYSRHTHGSLPCSLFIKRTTGSPCLSIAYYRTLSRIQVESLRCVPKKSLVCGASSSGQRRNPDFSRQNKQGFSRSRSRQNGERDNFENREEHEPVSSKNGPLLSTPDTTKFHNVTATPGPREKEIVELFRKVQAQLRERAAIKEEKKIESLQGRGKENETVDSLLKLLRKHSVEQGKRIHFNSGSGELTSHHSAPNGRLNGEKSTISIKTVGPAKEEHKTQSAATSRRPVSKFQKKSPVPQVRLQPVYTREDGPESLHEMKKESMIETHPDDIDLDLDQELDHDPEPELENILSNMTIIHEAESSGDESEIEEENEPYRDEEAAEEVDFSSLKLTELRALAKVRGLKGYSKLKKVELVKMLSENPQQC